MLFSVIIPAYNCTAFLSETVSRILNSGLWDFEILLIDDGSTDGTAQLCDRLAAENPCIRCIHQANSGVSAARNRGIETARGEYILFFDSDDGVDPKGLRNAAQIAAREKPDMLIFGLSFDYYFHNKLYRRDELVYPGEGLFSRDQWGEAFGELYRYNALSPVWNKFLRRELLMEKHIRFLGNLIEMEDFVFSVHCLIYCDDVYLLPEAIYRYRQAESERNTYNRLCRIESLSAYMIPFYDCLEQLVQSLQPLALDFDSVRAVAGQIYGSLFHEQLRFASPGRIRAAAEDMLGSDLKMVIENEDPALFALLQKQRYYIVWLRNSVSRIRHWVAVRVKYLLRFRRQ